MDAYGKSGAANVTTERINNSAYKISITKNILGGKAGISEIFTVYGDGSIHVANHFTIDASGPRTVMRLGNDLMVNKQLSNIQWYGRGPWENYWDRKYASEVGIYRQQIDQQYFPYARPQESGNKTDVRWFTLTNEKERASVSILPTACFRFRPCLIAWRIWTPHRKNINTIRVSW